ncbi:MAG: hypothetical protein AAF985_00175 [Bacteroidota bacterium]
MDSTANKLSDFPMTWVGQWIGQLEIYNNAGLAQSVEMELDIRPIDNSSNFIWAITYGPDKVAGRRSYELATVNKENGLYLIDEKNTIKLESYLFNNKLYSRFEVMGSWLLSSYEKQGEEIVFEIISGKGEAVSKTGGQNFENQEIPEVKAFPIAVNQRARLSRKKASEKK